MTGDPLVQPHDFDENPERVAQVLDFRRDFERDFEHVRLNSSQHHPMLAILRARPRFMALTLTLRLQKTLQEGGFNVNEIGSVHQVFTQAEGCVLLVLGAGANVTIEPEHYPEMGHPFLGVTVSGTSGWQGQSGGKLTTQDGVATGHS